MPMRNNTARVGEDRVPCSPIIHSSLAQSQTDENLVTQCVGPKIKEKLTMKRRTVGPSLASALPLGTAAGHPARHGWFGWVAATSMRRRCCVGLITWLGSRCRYFTLGEKEKVFSFVSPSFPPKLARNNDKRPTTSHCRSCTCRWIRFTSVASRLHEAAVFAVLRS